MGRHCQIGHLPTRKSRHRSIILATAVTLIAGAAFAQSTTGPGNQGDTMTKPGMSNLTSGSMSKESTGMSRGGMTNGNMNQGTGDNGASSSADVKNSDKMQKTK